MTNAKQSSSFFMVKSSSRLINKLLTRGIAHAADSQQAFIQLAHKLLTITEAAYTCQDFTTVKEASDLLMALPVPQAQSAGLWYQAVIKRRNGQITEASKSLEELIANPHTTPRFRGRALQTIGAIYHCSESFGVARQFYLESAQYIKKESPRDAYVFASAVILHSCAISNEGDSRQALKELSSIESLVEKLRDPLITAFYCNNVAVEFLELERLTEATQYSRIACSSPLAFAYPEWKETALEIEQQTTSKNIVAVAVSPEPRKRPAQPKFLLVVLRFSPPVRGTRPIAFRQRVTCNNPTIELVVLVARIRAPSF